MKSFRSVFIILCLFISFPLSVMAAPVSSLVPLDSWIYPALDKLEGLGFIESSLQGMRPYTRLEAARQVQEAAQNAAREFPPAVVNELLSRLENELSDALAEVRGESVPSSYFKPLRQLDMTYVYQDGRASSYPRTNASQYALNTNNFGIGYADGSNGEFRLLGDARLGKIFQLEWQPLVLSSSDETADLQLLQGRAAVELGPVEISVGRQSLWWGQGHHGALILTNNATPLDMLRITNPVPVRLPWILEYLGPFRFDVFWSKLDEDRVVPEPYFAGLRLNFKPLPWFEFGATRTVMFGGEGRPDVGFSDFLTILGGNNNFSRAEDTSNSIASLDWRIKLPALWQTEFYAEMGGEDQLHRFPTKKAWLVGLYLPIIEPTHRLALRLECADLNYHMGTSEGNGQYWYRHSVYKSGYTYDNLIMGHHVGGEGRDYYAALDWYFNRNWSMTASFDYEERSDYLQPVSENHYQPGLQILWQGASQMDIRLELFYDKVQNFDHVAGAGEKQYMTRLGAAWRW